MNAIILAAGQGRRLSPLTDDCPKCLLPLGESTFLQFQIAQLKRAGIASIAVVTGFCAGQVVEACNGDCRFFHNAEFASTNSLYSLMQAAESAEEGCLVMNSDVVFHPAILDKLIAAPYPNALLVDFDASLGDEEMKVQCDAGRRLTKISKTLPAREAHGENLGIVRMGPEAARAVVTKAREAAADGKRNLWVPQGVAQILDEIAFYAVPIEGLPWTEVDFHEDLKRAQETIYPLCCE